MICIQNKGYEVSLEKGKVYHVKEDTEAKKGNIFVLSTSLEKITYFRKSILFLFNYQRLQKKVL